jgi:hypothetical protein
VNRLVSISGIVLALAFMVLSAAINWRYGHSIGRDAGDQLIYAAISLAADIAKAITPFFFWYALKNRHFIPAAASALFWIACTGYSLSSAAGFAELNRAEQTGGFATRKADHAALQVELARKEAQLKALGDYEPPAVTAQRLEVLRQNPRWPSFEAMRGSNRARIRTFCAEYHTFEAARQKGIEAAKLATEIASQPHRRPCRRRTRQRRRSACRVCRPPYRMGRAAGPDRVFSTVHCRARDRLRPGSVHRPQPWRVPPASRTAYCRSLVGSCRRQ